MIDSIAAHGTRSMYTTPTFPARRGRANRSLWRLDWTGDAYRLAKLVTKLASLSDLERDWDTYEADPPNEVAVRLALKALSETWRDLLPVDVVPSVEGGVTLVYIEGQQGYAEVEFGNDGEVVAALRSASGEVDAWDIDVETGMRSVLGRFRRLSGRGG